MVAELFLLLNHALVWENSCSCCSTTLSFGKILASHVPSLCYAVIYALYFFSSLFVGNFNQWLSLHQASALLT